MSRVTSAGGSVRFGMDLVATLAALLGCALLVWMNWGKVFPPGPRIPAEPVSIDGASVKGSSGASVVLIEFSDYQCPFCAKAAIGLMPQIAQKYVETGRVQLAFRHHPLSQLHPMATQASEAALCAGRQGKFWEMHAALFADQKNMDAAALVDRANDLALDEKAFRKCLAGEAVAQVEKDLQEAAALGLTGTPVFLVGRRQVDGRVRVRAVLNGLRPVGEFEHALNEALKSAESGEPMLKSVLLSGGAVVGVAAWIGMRRRKPGKR